MPHRHFVLWLLTWTHHQVEREQEAKRLRAWVQDNHLTTHVIGIEAWYGCKVGGGPQGKVYFDTEHPDLVPIEPAVQEDHPFRLRSTTEFILVPIPEDREEAGA